MSLIIPKSATKKPPIVRDFFTKIVRSCDIRSALYVIEGTGSQLVSMVPVKDNNSKYMGQEYLVTYFGEKELEWEVLC